MTGGQHPCRGCGNLVPLPGAWCGGCGDTSALDSLGTLYRNEQGHEVWRIRDHDGRVIAEDVASDRDTEWIANGVSS